MKKEIKTLKTLTITEVNLVQLHSQNQDKTRVLYAVDEVTTDNKYIISLVKWFISYLNILTKHD